MNVHPPEPFPTVVIARRQFEPDGIHYRTRYYVECVDGRPRLGDKADAAQFLPATAEQVARQLSAIAGDGWFMHDPTARLARSAE